MNKRLVQFEFRNEPSELLWRNQVKPVFEQDALTSQFMVIKNFSDLLANGQLERMMYATLTTQPTFEARFNANAALLKSEVSDLNQLSQNICALVVDKSMKSGCSKRIVDRNKTGLKVIDVGVMRTAVTSSEIAEARLAMVDLNSAVRFKAHVRSKDTR